MKPITWNVPSERGGRLDSEVKHGAELSNSKARDCVRTGKITVDGERVMDPAASVKPGQAISLNWAAPHPARTEPLGVKLVYRDDHLLVIDKPTGLLSNPTPEGEQDTALAAAGRLCRGRGRGRTHGPKVVHRLDKVTSGLMIFARGAPVARALRTMFDEHQIRRTYHCVVQGQPRNNQSMITSMLVADTGRGRRGSRKGTLSTRPVSAPDPGPMPGSGKRATTRYRVVTRSTDGQRTAMEVWLATGRTHQIRIHLSEIGCPVLGEQVYGRIPGAPRLALHSARLSLTHPITGQTLSFDSPWPQDLIRVKPLGPGWRS